MLVLLHHTTRQEAQDEHYRALEAPVQVGDVPVEVGSRAARGRRGRAALPRGRLRVARVVLVADHHAGGVRAPGAQRGEDAAGRRGGDPRGARVDRPGPWAGAAVRRPQRLLRRAPAAARGGPRRHAPRGDGWDRRGRRRRALWRGRRVLLVDGSSASMPDEAALQAAYPQPPGQRAGCGFPAMRLLAVFCWGTGALLEIVMGPLHHSEQKLFRTILDRFRPGDVALADRYYCSYVDIARAEGRGAEVVFRLHQRRSTDFRQGRRLGRGDRLVTWKRPRQWLSRCGLTREEFERLPEEMALRMVRTTLEARGSRSRKLVVVTTILDPEEAPADDLLELYRDRWMAELNLRSLKTVLRMETLRGRSVDVVRKEVLVHALLYNLIRLLMWEAARSAGKRPRRMSFAGTLHRLQTMGRSLLLGGAGRGGRRLRPAGGAAGVDREGRGAGPAGKIRAQKGEAQAEGLQPARQAEGALPPPRRPRVPLASCHSWLSLFSRAARGSSSWTRRGSGSRER